MPIHIEGDAGVMVIFGTGLTISLIVLLLVQPSTLTPITVYVVVTVGETITELATVPIGFHVYPKAPLADNVALPPGHIAVGEATTVMVGPLLTETVNCAELEQLPLAAITV